MINKQAINTNYNGNLPLYKKDASASFCWTNLYKTFVYSDQMYVMYINSLLPLHRLYLNRYTE